MSKLVRFDSRSCEECGVGLRLQSRRDSLYCSSSCRQRAYRRRKAWKGVEFTVKCDWCMVRHPLPHMSLWVRGEYDGAHFFVLCYRCCEFARDRGLVRAIANDEGEVINEIPESSEEE